MGSRLLSVFLLLTGSSVETQSGEKMNVEKYIQSLEQKVEALEARLRNLEDIEEINKLQRIYGYYVDNKMWDQIVDLFTDNDSSIEIGGRGVYRNKKGVETFFLNVLGKGRYGRLPGELYNHMQIQGVVHVDTDGQTAKGRWRAFAQAAADSPTGKIANWGEGVYENEYIKEDGKWKFKNMHWYQSFQTLYEQGWGREVIHGDPPSTEFPPDDPPTVHKPFPSNYAVPFHYKNPISEK